MPAQKLHQNQNGQLNEIALYRWIVDNPKTRWWQPISLLPQDFKHQVYRCAMTDHEYVLPRLATLEVTHSQMQGPGTPFFNLNKSFTAK